MRFLGYADMLRRVLMAAEIACRAPFAWHVHAEARSWRLVRKRREDPWRRSFDFARYAHLFQLKFFHFAFPTTRPAYRVRQRFATLSIRRPTVLHVIPNLFVGGSTQLVIDLVERLGHRIDMQVLTSAVAPGGVPAGLVVHCLPTGTPHEAFGSLLAAVKPDLVHIHYWGDVDLPWYMTAFDAAAATGAAILTNVNTPVAPLVNDRIARHVVVSNYVLETFASELSNVDVIYPGVDLERFRPPTSFDVDAADSIGMIYRLCPDKLDTTALTPLILVAKQRPRTRIFVIGDGPLFASFIAQVRQAGLHSNFVFTGEVRYEILPEYLRLFRVFVAPAARESFGHVVPMAMATGHAVAGNNIGALPEILGSDEMLGRSDQELADILLHLLDAPAEVETAAATNISGVRRFDVKVMIQAYRRVYGELLGYDLDLMPRFPSAEAFEDI